MSASPPSADVGAARSAALFATLGRIVFRYRDALVPVLLVALLIVARPLAPFGSERLDYALDVLGFLIAAAGQALRITVIGFAYIQRGGANKQLSAPKLVCEGFYAHCRNPMYVGDFLLFLGLAVIYNSPLVYCVALPIVATVLVAMVSAEETFLRGRFGAEYEAYCRRVNRFIPRLRGLRDTTRDMRFDWRRVLRKEYGTTLAWVSAAFALMAWERIVRLGFATAEPQLWGLLCLYLPVPVLYGVVRWLKLSGRLSSPDYVTPRGDA